MNKFSNILIGQRFFFQGTEYVKKSTRTASLFACESKWFYFSKNDQVVPAKTITYLVI
ncbi:hypothetical protein NVP1101O_202 [Vibrio phage 1.101.O._10N.261.45.C6]|nr:hypothetical protein NVP1101O_202 [Vibrio phage 1.101.O._10N.261.45.C6]